MKELLARILRAPTTAVLFAWTLACAISLAPTLQSGRFLDDHAQLAMLEHRYPIARSPIDLYAFARTSTDVRALRAAGVLPWWSSDHWRLAMLRPLPSALAALDHRIAPRSALFARAHSALWLLLLLAGSYGLLTRLLGPTGASVGVLLYALSTAPVIPLGWIAARNALVAQTCLVWTFVCLLDHVRAPTRSRALRCVTASLLASLSGEYALAGGLAALLLLAMSSVGASRTRVMAAACVLPLAAGALVGRWGGYGAAHATAYLDPVRDLHGFVHAAPARVVALASNLLWASPVDAPPAPAWWAIAFVLLHGLAMVLLPPRAPSADRRPWMAWSLGALASLVPFAAAPPSSRLLLLPALAVSALLGGCVQETRRAPPSSIRTLHRAVVAALVVVHGVLSPLAAHREAAGIAEVMREADARMRSLTAAAAGEGVETVLVLQTDSLDVLHHAQFVFEASGGARRRWRVLSFGAGPMLALRIDARTLDLRALQGPLLALSGERYRAASETFREGQEVALGDVRVTVLALDHGAPSVIRVRADRDLDDPSMRWITRAGSGFARAHLPAQRGAAMYE